MFSINVASVIGNFKAVPKHAHRMCFLSKSVLSTEDSVSLTFVSIYKTNESTLKLVGLPVGKSTLKLFNILSKFKKIPLV